MTDSIIEKITDRLTFDEEFSFLDDVNKDEFFIKNRVREFVKETESMTEDEIEDYIAEQINYYIDVYNWALFASLWNFYLNGYNGKKLGGSNIVEMAKSVQHEGYSAFFHTLKNLVDEIKNMED
jgi:hypothetical protein